jgi:hypothetical protein
LWRHHIRTCLSTSHVLTMSDAEASILLRCCDCSWGRLQYGTRGALSLDAGDIMAYITLLNMKGIMGLRGTYFVLTDEDSGRLREWTCSGVGGVTYLSDQKRIRGHYLGTKDTRC